MTFDDLERWARGHGLEAVLIATGAVLLGRLVRWAANRLVARSEHREATTTTEETAPRRSPPAEPSTTTATATSSTTTTVRGGITLSPTTTSTAQR